MMIRFSPRRTLGPLRFMKIVAELRSMRPYVRLAFCSRRSGRYARHFRSRDCHAVPVQIALSSAHLSVKQRSPFKNSFCPSHGSRRPPSSRVLPTSVLPSQTSLANF